MMSRKIAFAVLNLMGLALVAAAVWAATTVSSTYRLLETPTASEGATSSRSYRLYSTTGQPVPVGFGQGPTYQLHAGFVRVFRDKQ
jgi:hypothetical protein